MSQSIHYRSLVPAAAIAVFVGACDARAQTVLVATTEKFDGRWQFDMEFVGDGMCAFEGLPLIARLRDGRAQGLYTEPNYGGWTYSIVVTDAGKLEMVMGGYAIVRLSGSVSGDTGQGTIDVTGTSLRCGGEWTAHKLPELT